MNPSIRYTTDFPYTPCKKCISDSKICTFKSVPKKRGRPCGKKNKKKEHDLTVRIINKEKGKVYRHN